MTPKTLGRYTIESTIGEGAMGRVYRGFDPLAKRAVAIKTIREEALTSATRDDYTRRFQREAQAAASVIHPSIVTIFDVGETYFVMELVDGETLQSVISRKGRLSPREMLTVLAPIADALDFVHGKGLVHRDIKPANIMVLPNGRAKLMDFGVVHSDSGATMTSVGVAVGSPPYMAPEQILGGEITARTDIFALGAVTYEMLSGRRAFDAENVTAVINRVVNESPRPLREENPGIPEHFETAIGRALAKDPKDRPATAMEFAAALHRGVDGTGATAASVSTAPSAPEARVVRPDAATVDLTMPTPRPEAASPRGRTAAVVVAAVVLAAAIGLVVRGGFPKTVTPPPVASPSAAATATEASATAVPSPPPVTVESEPSGGAVFLDDKEIGKTPLELAVAPGEHVVRVTHEGFASGQLQITVTAEGHPPLRFDLDPVTAALSIHSEPSGARASMDGREVGTTPVEKLAVYPGAHRISVGLAGYTAWSESFEATAGKPVELIAHLKPVPRKQAKAVAPTPSPTPVPPALREGDLVALGPDVTPPRKVSGKTAYYPSAALAKRLQGKVTIELLVTETGEPKDLRVVESAGQLLDDVVLDAVRSWRYEPAVKNGVKVRVVIRESQSFELRAPK